MSRLILITGGARSGKSDFAQRLAHEMSGDDVVFIATAQAGDDDMAQRIAAHRRSRPPGWRTVEAPRDIGTAITAAGSVRAIVVDCLTLLVSNVLLSLGDYAPEDAAQAAVDEELRLVSGALLQTTATVIVVTNEVGLGIVPENRLARQYRDLLGRANANLARAAEFVYLLVAGLPVEIKSLAVRRECPQ
jgi:adenosylcobinamide kinase/adenosylcobinamide-phosphate guanylyltransferase